MIQLGSQGPEVRAWQQYLSDKDYDVTVDGIFGQATFAATVKFQQWCGELTADGVVGQNTYKWAAANEYKGGFTA
jgi:peptidoglycan hydrolase-like protein with peptidoglycan-binding domain